MIYSYHLTHSDYLDYLFYSTSKSKKVQKRRALNKLVLMIVIVLTGFMLFNKNGPIASAAFFLLCLPLYFFYSRFEKRQYTRHFTRFIKDHFMHRIGKPATIEVMDDSFHVIDDEDNVYSYNDIEELTETGTLIIIQLKNGVAVVLPKDKIEASSSLIERLSQEVSERKILFTRDKDWKWK